MPSRRGIRPGIVLSDPIKHLHQETLRQIAASEREVSKEEVGIVDLMGGNQRGALDPDLRRAILDTELEQQTTSVALQGDDYEITYDENGYPELPPCLDRRTT